MPAQRAMSRNSRFWKLAGGASGQTGHHPHTLGTVTPASPLLGVPAGEGGSYLNCLMGSQRGRDCERQPRRRQGPPESTQSPLVAGGGKAWGALLLRLPHFTD